MTIVKICGLSTPETITAAIENGADMLGFVFYPASPRYVSPEVAAYLSSYVPDRVKICGLFVDPDDGTLLSILSSVRIDIIQLHGSEAPERVKSIKAQTGRSIIKAIPVSTSRDLDDALLYSAFSDWILLDAKTGSVEYGGGGKTFDWSILDGFRPPYQWMLAGGLSETNVTEALTRFAPDALDVSSGIEIRRGEKDATLIRSFLNRVRHHDHARHR